ncbi:LuxE/PaaK family acyltransferase [Blattabacterium cuenoti]|uniref:LuxE/PaaK family acyltransferase n=1 Tax=Blattabacterium cuenoti TaxID=1653831 RepID=UPI00163D1AF4|nr:LuxE family acyl-protein synthetase/acyl-CoA reductase [Blattabacterium cuenoti]
MNFKEKIFSISSKNEFEGITMDIFHYQMMNNNIYKNYVHLLNKKLVDIKNVDEIPFLPISFFKTHRIDSNKKNNPNNNILFKSSGTTTGLKSKHFVSDLSIYNSSILKGFEYFYGPIEKFKFFCFFPHQIVHSSLIYMVNYMIHKTVHNGSIFIPSYQENFIDIIHNDMKNDTNIFIFGLSSYLLNFIENKNICIKKNGLQKKLIVMETGGMKGKRKELIRDELHYILKNYFHVKHIHSEYGMTELLSQAYSKKNGIFQCPPWMKIYIRDIEDPFLHIENNKIGGIDIIDLSNYLSCSFVSTDDLGRKINEKEFEVLGRIDFSDIRGCNTMI